MTQSMAARGAWAVHLFKLYIGLEMVLLAFDSGLDRTSSGVVLCGVALCYAALWCVVLC